MYGGWIDDNDDASDLIFSPPSGISVSSKLEVYVGYYSLIKVNGSNYNTGGHNTAGERAGERQIGPHIAPPEQKRRFV